LPCVPEDVRFQAIADIPRLPSKVARSLMTHNVNSPPRIDALQKRQLQSLAGHEHGRTIPLAEVALPYLIIFFGYFELEGRGRYCA
jgi:hypothetical protein